MTEERGGVFEIIKILLAVALFAIAIFVLNRVSYSSDMRAVRDLNYQIYYKIREISETVENIDGEQDFACEIKLADSFLVEAREADLQAVNDRSRDSAHQEPWHV